MLNTLSYCAALDLFHELELDCLPDLAVELLLAGIESHSLALLAGETALSNCCDLRELFYASLTELGLTVPSRIEAAILVRNQLLGDIISGHVLLRAGAAKLCHLSAVTEGDFPEDADLGVDRFLSLHSGYENIDLFGEEDQRRVLSRLDAAVLTECQRVLDAVRLNMQALGPQ